MKHLVILETFGKKNLLKGKVSKLFLNNTKIRPINLKMMPLKPLISKGQKVKKK